MLTELRHTLRSLAKAKAFTTVAVLIVAIGIGASATMFSAVNALVLRPVALPHPERLVAVYETNLARNQAFFSVSIPNYLDWKQRAQSWESLAAINWRAMNLTGQGDPELIQVKAVTANFLPTLGVPLATGRNFLDEEDRPGGRKVAIITEPFWHRRLGGAADALGSTLTFDGEIYTIVGITAPGQPLADDLEVVIPLAAEAASESRSNHEMQVYGRLKPGVTIDEADAELKAIAQQIWTEHPDFDRGWSTRLVPFAQEIVGEGVRKALYVLLGSVALLLLLACANLSNLLLVRSSARSHELAVRTALGASRTQIIRQIVTESLVVTLAGGLLGMVVSLWAADLMRSLPLPRAREISVDLRVLSVALCATLLAGVLSGLAPALRSSRAQPQDALKSRAPRSGYRSRLRDGLVVAQLAISLTLLIAASLLGQSFYRLLQVNPGFNPADTVTVSLRPAGNAAEFYERLVERLATSPGVTHAGLISALPLTEGNTSLNVFPQGESVLPSGESIQAGWRLVDGGYFGAMQIPVLKGQTFAGLTPDDARRSVVISASLARLLWGDTDPIGRQLDPGGNRRMLTVIGVVGDVRTQTLGTAPVPTFYWSMHRFIYGPMHLVVRSTSEQGALVSSVRALIKSIDPTVPVFRVRTLEQIRATSLEQERIILAILSSFTAVALLLAALGTYGVITFMVQQRTQEIGIRMAVGAQKSDIVRLILGHGSLLIFLGAATGLIGAFVTMRFLEAMLYETTPGNAWSYLVAIGTLAGVALTAAFVPASRAARIDPNTALRAE